MSDKISISVAGKVTHTAKMSAKKEDAVVAPVQEEKKTSTKKTKKVPVVEETVADE